MSPLFHAYRIADNYATVGIQLQFHAGGMAALHVMLWKWGLILGAGLK